MIPLLAIITAASLVLAAWTLVRARHWHREATRLAGWSAHWQREAMAAEARSHGVGGTGEHAGVVVRDLPGGYPPSGVLPTPPGGAPRSTGWTL